MTPNWLDHPQTLERLKTLVRHNTVPWGCLIEVERAEDVLTHLKACPPSLLPDHCTSLFDIYHSPDLGYGCPSRVCTTVLSTAIHLGTLDPETPVYLQHRHGNVFALMKPADLPEMVTKSKDIHFIVSRKSQCLIAHHIGRYHYHHALYEYYHLDGKVTTIAKLLATNRFTSVKISIEEDFELCDIPY